VRHRRTSPQPPSADDVFFASVEKLSPLCPASRAAWEKLLSPRSFGAGEWLLRAGEQAHWSFFVVRGLVREFYVSDSGEEHTRVFVPEDQLTGSLLDLISGQPAVTWIQALEALCDRFPGLQRCARHFAERLYARKAKREYEMLALSAQQRHAQWLTEHAALDGRIRRQLLASYLGITPEHLSRLRRGPR
jgi:CRP-like cAMP-binding protein